MGCYRRKILLRLVLAGNGESFSCQPVCLLLKLNLSKATATSTFRGYCNIVIYTGRLSVKVMEIDRTPG
jgi:hypothetical protein